MVRSATIFVGVVVTSFLLAGTAAGAEPRAYQVLTGRRLRERARRSLGRR